jgi:hypothetical protein
MELKEMHFETGGEWTWIRIVSTGSFDINSVGFQVLIAED